jgi:Fur family peroxide stress response transcriptional regulator
MREKLNNNAQAVLDVVQAAAERHDHLTAREIYEAVQVARPRIGVATVYRILHHLVTQGTIKEIGASDMGGEASRYDGRVSRHDHAVCTNCGALLDIPVEVLISSEALQAAARATGVTLTSHEVRLYGLCPSCQHIE